MSDWIEIKTGGLPDFREYGFHLNKPIEVRRDDGREEVVIYQGWGLFGNGLEDVTHWRPHE